jgi:hypothetical protein
MANANIKKTMKELNSAESQTSVAINGTDVVLDKENLALKEIIRQTTQRTSHKYGTKTNGKSLDYFTELSLSSVMIDSTLDPSNKKAKKLAENNPKQYFKQYMVDKQIADQTALLSGDVVKQISYKNYEAIYKHIPECATALKIYRDNILSPDDFTKRIFNYDYVASTDKDLVEKVKKNINEIACKYKLDEKTADIIQQALLYGDAYYAVLSLEDELMTLLKDPSVNQGILQENIKMYDTELSSRTIDGLDISLNESEKEAFNIFFNQNNIVINENQINNKNQLTDEIAKFINEHFIIDSKLSLLQERAEYEYSKRQDFMSDIINPTQKSKDKKKKIDNDPLYISGSALKYLDPSKVIKLELDDICYGYYYYEEREYNTTSDVSDSGDYLGSVMGKSQSNMTAMSSTGATIPVGNKTLSTENLDATKYRLISDVFLNAISKKIDKEYIRHNKQFKDFIYSVVKETQFAKKRIHLTFFTPDEVVHFKVDPVYKNIPFFAKLYLAMLTNMVIINMGRGHDKRLFYVQTGLDEQFEAAISNTIESIKSKEFRLSDNDINTVLNLNVGALDDWFIPTNVSGERPIEIETVPGMDIDIANNTFLDWLRKSMMNGMYIPSNLIDSMVEVDYARTLSAQNANFVRSVVQYQMHLQKDFSNLIRKLYKNEYRFNDDGTSNELEKIDIDKIEVTFPSPASLNMTNMQEQINTASTMADELSLILVPAQQDGSTDDLRMRVKAEVFKKFFPGFDYAFFEDMIHKELAISSARDTVKEKMLNGGQDQSEYGY